MASKAKRWLSIAAQIALVACVYLGVTAWQERRALATNQVAPAARLLELDGREFSLEQLRGKAVLLHFWATWCGVCRLELSGLNALSDRLPKGAMLVSVVADGDDPRHVERFVREHGLRYPVVRATDETLRQFHVTAFPTNYYLDDKGVIKEVTVGMSTRLSMWIRLWLAT